MKPNNRDKMYDFTFAIRLDMTSQILEGEHTHSSMCTVQELGYLSEIVNCGCAINITRVLPALHDLVWVKQLVFDNLAVVLNLCTKKS